jgi:hypothetical protein
MNKRIKELAEQCWDRRLDGVHFDIEMFAKLVIGHCCPERPWVGLTDEEIGVPTESIQPHEAIMFARVIEALIKEKNK